MFSLISSHTFLANVEIYFKKNQLPTRSFYSLLSSLYKSTTMKDKNNIEEQEVNNLISRIRFKSPEYDSDLNYNRLQERIGIEDIPLKKNISPAWKWISIAASIALLIVSSFHFINSDQPHSELVWYEVTAVADAKTKVILPDSSTVWLNANASLTYPRSFDDENRRVDISGEAFFQIRKNEMKPFIVDLGGLQVKVLGTSFNVTTDAGNDEIRVSLLEGKVALYESGESSESAKILMPNEQAIYSRSKGEIEILPIRMDNVMSWFTGEFRFENNTLAEIAEELERAFHVKIHIENETIRKKTFYAVFEDKETLDEILSILQISAKYRIEKRRGEIYIN